MGRKHWYGRRETKLTSVERCGGYFDGYEPVSQNVLPTDTSTSRALPKPSEKLRKWSKSNKLLTVKERLHGCPLAKKQLMSKLIDWNATEKEKTTNNGSGRREKRKSLHDDKQ